MWYERLVGGAALAVVISGGAVQGQDIPAGVHPVPATVLQVLKAFDNPEGAIFSADGQHVFISNAAEIGDRGQGFGWAEGEGYISKLAVQPNGTLTMVEERLIDGLTGPLGMAVLPVATGKFPGRHDLRARGLGAAGRRPGAGDQGPDPPAHQADRVRR